jgi:hypothetical protein
VAGIIHNLPLTYAVSAIIICRHADSHFDDDQLQMDMELAHQMSVAESSTDANAMVVISLRFFPSHFVLIIVPVAHGSFQRLKGFSLHSTF